MDNLKTFQIRNYFKVKSNEQILYGKEAVIEYIRQLHSVLRTELWFDYDFGLEFTNILEGNISIWIRDNLERIPLIKEINELKVNKLDGFFEVYLNIELIDNEKISEEILLNIK